MRRIQPRPSRVGAGPTRDPDELEELQVRREKHERLTGARPAQSFATVLAGRMDGDTSKPPSRDAEPRLEGAIEPHLGLDPAQDAALASASGRRSAKVIVKG